MSAFLKLSWILSSCHFPVCYRLLSDLTLLRSLEVLVCLLADPVAVPVQPRMEGPQPQGPERAVSRTGKAEVPIATKLQMLEDIDNNVSHKLVARKFNVSVSTISYILKKRKKIEEAAELNEGRKRLVRTTKYQHINNMMLEFYNRCQAVLIPVASPLLQTVSRQFATAIGMDSFTGSNGWAAAFLHRNRITSFAKRGEKKEERRKRMLTDHQQSMVNVIVNDIIRNNDSFKSDVFPQTVNVPIPAPQSLPDANVEPAPVLNVAFEPLGTVELIPHHTFTPRPAPDGTNLGRPSAKRSSSGNLKIRSYAQAIQALSALQRYAYGKGSSAVLPMLGEIAVLLSKEEVEKGQKKPLNSKKRRRLAEEPQYQSQDDVEIVKQSPTTI
ncbi:hypothetical protein RvY_13760 [Ramazzottius varieornatus]|uniref:HTH CENPB-type domain-containing protein n=1 Tax=Ramazzottius varieornatus TaxID=947166 RepID=A0A1D1VU84_RAMVA|nr:hypothetical protein RvY_13760 [Ramazzottius varieornatus]